MCKSLITACFVFLLSLSVGAQHAVKIAGFKAQLKENMHDSIRVQLLTKLSNEYVNQGDNRMAVDYGDQALRLSQKSGYKNKLAVIYNLLANAYVGLSDYPKGMENHQKSLQISRERNNPSGIAISYNNIAIVYYNLADFPKTLEYLQKSLKIQEELGDQYKIAAAIGNIAVIYNELHEDSLSMIYQQKSFDMHEKMGNKTDMAASLNYLGTLYRQKKEFTKALEYHQKALAIAIELDEKEGMKTTYASMGALYLDMHDPNEALSMFFKAIPFSDEQTDTKARADIYITIATAYRQLKNNTEAVSYLEKAMTLAKSAGNLKEQKEAADGLYRIYKEKHDFPKALAYHELGRQLNDSIFNTSKNESFNSLKTQFALDRQENNLKAKADAALQKKEDEKAKQQTIIYIALGVLVLVLAFSYLLFTRFRISKAQNKVIEHQKLLVEHKNKEITDSILYTKRLQQAILPSAEMVKQYFPESFVYFKPKDIVAGDFYWMQHASDYTYFAVADCTGHGVPGAMVSIVCCNALNGALKEFGLTDPGLILDKTRQLVLETFEKSGEDIKDGMDISLIKIKTKNSGSAKVTLEWSGANNSLYYMEEGIFKTLKCDKQPVGRIDHPKPFTMHHLEVKRGTCLYFYTDGMADQFGGPKGKKLKYKNLNAHLSAIHHLDMEAQLNSIHCFFTEWKGALEQVDDVSIIGIRV